MTGIAKVIILTTAPLLMASYWMDKQPSYKPYQAPVLAPPATAVPFRETVPEPAVEPGQLHPTEASLKQGQSLFAINCAMCHGLTSDKPGPVGSKLSPPAPGLNSDLLRQRSDSHILNAITNGFGRMPPFKNKLSPRERHDLINFLRTRR